MSELKNVLINTDGECIGNPGPGGYAAQLEYQGHRKELSGGFKLTTNNRMELMAVIAGLEVLKEKCKVTILSDSQYVVNAMSQGWAKRWQAKGWKRNKREQALNPDLWQRLLAACEEHEVHFQWVKGHSGNPDNERCAQLAKEAARQPNLPIDEGYEKPK